MGSKALTSADMVGIRDLTSTTLVGSKALASTTLGDRQGSSIGDLGGEQGSSIDDPFGNIFSNFVFNFFQKKFQFFEKNKKNPVSSSGKDFLQSRE